MSFNSFTPPHTPHLAFNFVGTALDRGAGPVALMRREGDDSSKTPTAYNLSSIDQYIANLNDLAKGTRDPEIKDHEQAQFEKARAALLQLQPTNK